MISALVSASRRFTGPMGCGADAPLKQTAVFLLRVLSEERAGRAALATIGGAEDGGDAVAFLLEFAARRRFQEGEPALQTCLHSFTFSALYRLSDASPAICERARQTATPSTSKPVLNASAAWAAGFVARCCNPTCPEVPSAEPAPTCARAAARSFECSFPCRPCNGAADGISNGRRSVDGLQSAVPPVAVPSSIRKGGR
jgi:hypothetical protein